MKSKFVSIVVMLAALGVAGCQSEQQSGVWPIASTSQPAESQAPQDSPTTTNSSAAGQWGAFNEVLRDGGVYKNSSGKYLKLTFEPLKDNLDAVFADAPSGSVTITDANGDRSKGGFSLESDHTLTITLLGKTKKMVFEISRDGQTLNPIGRGQKLTLQL